jgi:hypothetical protein
LCFRFMPSYIVFVTNAWNFWTKIKSCNLISYAI